MPISRVSPEPRQQADMLTTPPCPHNHHFLQLHVDTHLIAHIAASISCRWIRTGCRWGPCRSTTPAHCCSISIRWGCCSSKSHHYASQRPVGFCRSSKWVPTSWSNGMSSGLGRRCRSHGRNNGCPAGRSVFESQMTSLQGRVSRQTHLFIGAGALVHVVIAVGHIDGGVR